MKWNENIIDESHDIQGVVNLIERMGTSFYDIEYAQTNTPTQQLNDLAFILGLTIARLRELGYRGTWND